MIRGFWSSHALESKWPVNAQTPGLENGTQRERRKRDRERPHNSIGPFQNSAIRASAVSSW